jgi:serine/threonine protein kinase
MNFIVKWIVKKSTILTLLIFSSIYILWYKYSLPSNTRYTKINEIGKGKYGKVFKGKDNKTNNNVAIKVFIYLSNTSNNEIKILSLLNHKNIVKILDYSIESLFIVMELCDYDLNQFLIDSDLRVNIINNFSSEISLKYNWTIQMVNAISYLHINNIIHRDIKPENILIKQENTWILKLTDFGVSKLMAGRDHAYTFTGTNYYMSPEMIGSFNSKYSKLTDVWSLGIVLFQLHCFIDKPEKIIKECFYPSCKERIPENFDSELFIKKMYENFTNTNQNIISDIWNDIFQLENKRKDIEFIKEHLNDIYNRTCIKI